MQRLQGHQQTFAKSGVAAVALALFAVQQVAGAIEQVVVPGQLAEVVERRGHGQVAAVGLRQLVLGRVSANQGDDLGVALLVPRQALVEQGGEDFGGGHVAAPQLFVGQVEHVGGLLQLGGAVANPLFQAGVELLQAPVLLQGQALQALAFAVGVLVGEGLAQGDTQFVVIPGFAQVAVDLPLVDRADAGVEVGGAGQQDAQGTGPALLYLGQQGGPIEAGHARVGNHQVDFTLREQRQGIGAAGGGEQFIGFAAQDAAQGAEDMLLVIHQQQGGTVLRFAHSSASPGCGCCAGSQTRKRVPSPGWLKTSMRPLCFCTML
ncbi:hypothetical protein D3C76_800340 [compost metagenome]